MDDLVCCGGCRGPLNEQQHNLILEIYDDVKIKKTLVNSYQIQDGNSGFYRVILKLGDSEANLHLINLNTPESYEKSDVKAYPSSVSLP